MVDVGVELHNSLIRIYEDNQVAGVFHQRRRAVCEALGNQKRENSAPSKLETHRPQLCYARLLCLSTAIVMNELGGVLEI